MSIAQIHASGPQRRRFYRDHRRILSGMCAVIDFVAAALESSAAQ
jgi:hypothetical protein